MIKKRLQFTFLFLLVFLIFNCSVSFGDTVTPTIDELNKQISILEEKNKLLEKEKKESEKNIEFYKEQNQNIGQTTSNAISNVTNMIYAVSAFITVLTVLGTIIIPNQIYKKDEKRSKKMDEDIKLAKNDFTSKIDIIEKEFQVKIDTQEKELKKQIETIETIEKKINMLLNEAKNSADEAKKSEQISKIYALITESLNLKKEKKLQEAINKINETFNYNPENELLSQIYAYRGGIYNGLKENELALKDYSKAIELNPKFVLAYINRGNIHYEIKQYELALKDYNKAIELDPKNAVAYNNIANYYRIQGEYDLACKEIAVSINLDNKSGVTYTTKAEICLCKNDIDGFYENIELAFKYGFPLERIYEDDIYKPLLDEQKFIQIIKKYEKCT